jgi:hypothetical protein
MTWCIALMTSSQSVDTVWLLSFLFGDRLLRGKTKLREGGYTEEHEQPSLDSEQSGQEHPSTLTSMNSLSTVLSDQDKVQASGRDASVNTRAEGDGTGQRASFNTNKHEQSGRSTE